MYSLTFLLMVFFVVFCIG